MVKLNKTTNIEKLYENFTLSNLLILATCGRGMVLLVVVSALDFRSDGWMTGGSW